MTGEADPPSRSGTPEAARRHLVDRVADRILPYPRDVAFANLLRSVRDLVLGRRPRSVIDAARAKKAEEQYRLERGRELLRQGDPIGAAKEAIALERLDPTNEMSHRLRLSAGRTEPIRGRAGDPLDRADIAAAEAQLRAEGHERPIVLLYHQASPDSPYQALQYRRAWANGIAALPLNDLADLPRLDSTIAPRTGRILHLHWVNRVLAGATGPDDLQHRLDRAAARLDAARAAGWTIAWTVHNILPHDSPFPTEEAALRQAIADRADLIHVMARATPELAAPWFTMPPERTLHVPIPSFRGAYPDYVNRSAARYALNLAGDARVVSLLGGLRPYKGLDLLLDAFAIARREQPGLNLLIAGLPARSPEITSFMDRALGQPNVHLHARMIPSDDMQLFLRASDAVVLPYVRTLNSALLMLALAFELPVIAPDLGAIPETVDASVATIFPAGNVEALASALADVQPVSPERAAVARRISDEHDADRISDQLMTALRRIVDDRATTGRDPS